MAPLRRWAPKGQRLHAKVPYGHWKTMTLLPHCAATGSMRPSCSISRSTPPALQHGSNNSSAQRSVPAISLSWTTSPATSGPPSGMQSGPEAHGFYSFRPTAQTSTRSSRSSQSSSTSCERPPNGPLKQPGDASALSSTPSRQTNAQTTSKTPDMRQGNVIRL